MRYFYDTEFIEGRHTIESISIGWSQKTGREYYAVSTEFDLERAGSWARTHVRPSCRRPPATVALAPADCLIQQFSAPRHDSTEQPVGAYDHAAL